MVLLLSFIIALPVHAAPPEPPGSVPDSDTIIPVPLAVTLNALGVVNTTFSVNYTHTADIAVECILSLDDDEDTTYAATVGPGDVQVEAFSDIPVGTHSLNVTCIDGVIETSVKKSVVVVDLTGIYVIIEKPLPLSIVNSTTSVTYRHSSTKALTCNLSISGAGVFTAASVSSAKTVPVTLSNGSHTANVTCANKTMRVVSPNVVFTVVNSTAPSTATGVVLLSPKETSPPKMNVTFYHTAPEDAMCTVIIDKKIVRGPVTLEPMERMTYSFSNMAVASYALKINCSVGTWAGVAEKKVKVTNTIEESAETLTITPKRALPGDIVTITGTFPAYTTVAVSVYPPSTMPDEFEVETTTKFSTEYELLQDAKAGTYRVSAFDVDNEDDVRNGTFTVVKRNTSIHLDGYKTEVVEGQSFSVIGLEFLPNDDVELSLIGAGKTVVNRTKTNAAGGFSFKYPANLPVRSYTLAVKSVENNAIAASLAFKVVLAPPPVIGTTPTCSDDEENGDEEGVDCGGDCPDDCEEEVSCYDGIKNGDEDGEDCGGSCTAECHSGGVESPDVEQNDDSDEDILVPDETPIEEEPAPIDGGGFNWMLIILPLVLVGLLLGGGGYLVYNGALDISSVEAFQASLHRIFGGGADMGVESRTGNSFGNNRSDFPSMDGHHAVNVDPSESLAVKTFIASERAKGFDDLTIRAALIAKGWEKNVVDGVFDELYRG